MASYVDLATFKSYLRHELSGLDDVDLQDALDAATEAINDHCGRTFTVAGSGSARVYVPTCTPVLFIDDATTVTAVTVDGASLTASTDYQKEPLNNLINGQTVPFTRLVRLGGHVWDSTTDNLKAAISVTATWGWAAVPSRVTQACRILAKEIAEARNQVGGYVDMGEIAARAVSHPKYGQLLMRLQRMDRTAGIA